MKNNKKGSALVYVIVLLAFSAIFGVGALSIAEHNVVMSQNEYNYEQAYLTSESGLQFINDQFKANYETSGLETAIENLIKPGAVVGTSVEATNAEMGVTITLTLEEKDPDVIRVDSIGVENGKEYKTTSYAVRNNKPFLKPVNVIGGKDKIKFDDNKLEKDIIENGFDGTRTEYDGKTHGDTSGARNDFKEDHALNAEKNEEGIKELKKRFEEKYKPACAVRQENKNHELDKTVVVDDACVYGKEAYYFIDPVKDGREYEIEIRNLIFDAKDKDIDVVYVYTYDKEHEIEEIEISGEIKVKDNKAQLIFITLSELKENDGDVEGLEIEGEDDYPRSNPKIDGWIIAPNTKVELESDDLDGSPITGGIIADNIELEVEDKDLILDGKMPEPSNYLDDIIHSILKPGAESGWGKSWSIKYVK